MPTYRRRYSPRYRRYRRYRRFYRRYKRYYGGTSKYINASSRSTIRIKCPVHIHQTVTQEVGHRYTPVFPLCLPWTRSHFIASALNSELYQKYAGLYEDVKCIGARVKLAILTPIGTPTVPSVRVISAWDRRWHHGEEFPLAAQLAAQGSAHAFTAINNSVAKVTRSCWASDLIEKCQWHSARLTPDAGGQWHDFAYERAVQNLNFFCPGLNCCFQVEGIDHEHQSAAITFNAEITYYFAFRCPMYSQDHIITRSAAPARSEEARDQAPDDETALRQLRAAVYRPQMRQLPDADAAQVNNPPDDDDDDDDDGGDVDGGPPPGAFDDDDDDDIDDHPDTDAPPPPTARYRTSDGMHGKEGTKRPASPNQTEVDDLYKRAKRDEKNV